MRALLFLFSTAILLLVSNSSVMAQVEQKGDTLVKKNPAKVEVRGRLVSSSDGEILGGAYVYVGRDKETPVTMTDSLGAFKVSCFRDSVLNLSFSYMGFQSFSRRYLPRSSYNAGIIRMAPDVMSIDEVVVSARVPLATQKDDTTEFNASALKMADDADLENLLKKLPGFEIKNGKIMAQGQEVTKIYIDGKKYFLNNPSEALKNLPASLVSKVKMFDDLSEEAKFSGYDDGTKHRSLNITTKNPNALKVFGNVNGNYGISEKIEDTFSDNKYDLSLSSNMFDLKRRITVSGNMSSSDQANTLEQSKYIGKGGKNSNNGVSLNYSSDLSEKVSFTGNYRMGNDKSYSASSSIQDYFPSDNYQSRIYDSENHTWGDNMDHNLNMEVEYKPTKKDKFIFSPTIRYGENNNTSINLANTVENGDSLNNSNTNNRGDNSNYTVSGKLSWMHAFNKRGRTLTTLLNFSQSENNGIQMQNIKERFLNTENILKDTIKNKRNNSDDDNLSYNLSVSYSEPLSKNSRLGINYNFDSNNQERTKESIAFRDREFNEVIGIDTALTNSVAVRRNQHRLGFNYNYNKKDKLSFRGGANVSYSQSSNEYSFLGVSDSLVNNNYVDISPRADLDIRLSKTSHLNFNYNGSTSSPNADQLEDILDVSNPLQVSKGNPNLKKSFRHMMGVRYSSSNSEAGTYLSFSATISQSLNNVATNMQFIKNDTIVNGYELQRGTRLSSPVNLNGGWNFDTNVNFSIPIKALKLSLNPSINYNYSHSPSIYDNVKTFSDSHRGGINFSISSNISEKFDISLNSSTSYQHSKNTQTGVAEILNEEVSANFKWVFWKGFYIGSNLNYSYSDNKRGTSVKRSYALLNAEMGKKFGKQSQFNVRFNASDILRQRNTVNYYLTDHYASTSYRTNTNTYYMIGLSYRLVRMGNMGGMGRMGGMGGMMRGGHMGGGNQIFIN